MVAARARRPAWSPEGRPSDAAPPTFITISTNDNVYFSS